MDLLEGSDYDDDDDNNNAEKAVVAKTEEKGNGRDKNNTSRNGDDDSVSQSNPSQEDEGVKSEIQNNNNQSNQAAQQQPKARAINRRVMNAAPHVSLKARVALQQGQRQLALVSPATGTSMKNSNNKLVLMNNPKTSVSLLHQPVQGPQVMDPTTRANHERQVLQQNVAVDEVNFHQQRLAFQRTGQSVSIDGQSRNIRTTLGYDKKRLEKFALQAEQLRKRPKFEDIKNNRNSSQDYIETSVEDDVVKYGIWGPPDQEEEYHVENSLSDIARGGVESLAPEQLAERQFIQERNQQRGIQQEAEEMEMGQTSAMDRLLERKMAHLLPPKHISNNGPMEATTKFHGSAEYDYKGNSWMAPPAGLFATANASSGGHGGHKCFVPKRCVHRFTGHNKGVHRIRLFPKTGHLLLSAGLDGKCKVWSVEQRKVMRTYIGHNAAVRDVQFNHDGSKFVSASFDRYLRAWNTETGEVLQTMTNHKVPYVVEFYPKDDNFVVVGCSDSKIVAYDITTGKLTQEYNHHLGPVNAIVFVIDKDVGDSNVKMVSSSDDKKILVWEWDIGVPIKYISDPTMHSIPSMTLLGPNNDFILGQSLDNHIVVLQAGGRFKLQRKKFSGHIVAGYACQVTTSPDGQFVMSGDGNGKIHFWEWKRCRLLQSYKGHFTEPSSGQQQQESKGGPAPAVGCVWHPLQPSTVFTCGWDGVIKMWE